jgi:hypothetical protein
MSINSHCGRNIVQITEKWCLQRGEKEEVLFSITETEPSEPSRGMKEKAHPQQPGAESALGGYEQKDF